jgi:hypothetical protein
MAVIHLKVPQKNPKFYIIQYERKKWAVYQALHGGDWIKKVNLEQTSIMYHVTHFVELVLSSKLQLGYSVEDNIS